jgi:hypothetical protein
MSAGPVTILDKAIDKIGQGLINLATSDWYVVLTTSSQTISSVFVGASGNALYSDLTAEVVGTGYTAGGNELTNVAWTPLVGLSRFSADNVAWVSLTATMKYAIIVRKVGASLTDILAFVDLETGDSTGRTSTAEDLVISWPNGLFDAMRA